MRRYMAEEIKNKWAAAEESLDHITKVMRENQKFLLRENEGSENAREAFEEIIELINDAIDQVIPVAKKAEGIKDYTERAMVFFVLHILMPGSYAIHVNLLSGNLPGCFMELSQRAEISWTL
jgi:hypothetical protein